MKRNLYFFLFIFFHFVLTCPVKAGVEIIPAGSFIINMGIVPQTKANGLKPYGLVYELLKNQNVPVKWVINPSKVKDGIDFSHNGIDYKGGTFIILESYRTATINTLISIWQTKGVVGATTVSDFFVDVFQTLQFAPNWTLDKDNGDIALEYFLNAEIPASAHGGSAKSGWKYPSQLGICDDIFVMPHADPTWATHSNLYYWNKNYKGNIWAACHAVSVMENVVDPTLTIKMNFLSSTGLVDYGDHADGTPPYTYTNISDPVSQFMGTLDASTENGSERIFMPLLGGGWNATTKVIAYDPTQANVPALSPGPASAAVYGRAYGDATRGYVMYEGGHDHTKGTTTSQVAAQRAFFNFSFFSTNSKALITVDLSSVPGVMVIGTPYPVNFTLPAGYSASQFKIKWKSSCGGTFFPSDTIQSPVFTPPNNPSITECVLSVDITDSCSRKNFTARSIFLTAALLPLKLGKLSASKSGNDIELKWETFFENDSTEFFIQRSENGFDFKNIGGIKSVNNNSGKLYQFADKEMAGSTVYYRIKAVDIDNKIFLGNVVTVSNSAVDNNSLYNVYPNPVKDRLLLKFEVPVNTLSHLAFFDMNGVLMFKKEINAGTKEIILNNMDRFPQGVYYLQYSGNNTVLSKKIVIVK